MSERTVKLRVSYDITIKEEEIAKHYYAGYVEEAFDPYSPYYSEQLRSLARDAILGERHHGIDIGTLHKTVSVQCQDDGGIVYWQELK